MKNQISKALSLLFVGVLTSCSSVSFKDLIAQNDGHWSQEQLAYLTNNNPSNTDPYLGNMSKSDPLPVHISFKSSGTKEKKVNIYEDEGLTALACSYLVKEDCFDFYNPKFKQHYYVTISDKNGKVVSESISFVVEPNVSGPRNLRVDGVENFRDIGGWGKVVDGKYQTFMKQGMIYRSGRFNEDKADPINVTVSEEGIYEAKNHLKLKTEIDLRRSSVNETGSISESPVADKYVNLPMYFGGNNILTYKGTVSKDDYQYDNPKAIKQFFELLADESNYPINFHCSIGKDRTGCMAYLIEGLMGFDEEIMWRDYMFTNFANAGMCKLADDITNRYGQTINDYDGTNLQQKTYNYLHNEIGVSAEDLNNIIKILGN